MNNLCNSTVSSYWIEFLIGGVLLRGLVGGIILSGIKGGLRYLFLPTERHFIYWIHYLEQGKNRGHGGTPESCGQGMCKDYV